MSTAVHTGACQCGAVRFRITGIMDNAHFCFCRMCQKAVGSLVAAWIGAPLSGLTWLAGIPQVFDSSEGVQRGFCADCGTSLFYRRDGRQMLWISIAALDRRDDISLKFVWGNESRSPLFAQMDQVSCHTSDEDYVQTDRAARTSRQLPDKNP